jgi:hypothetical protein
MNTDLKIARELTKQRTLDSILKVSTTLLSNPVVEILLGYLAIEYCQTHGSIVKDKWGRIDKDASVPLIPQVAGTVAEAGLLVAIAMQQPATLELMKSLISAGGEGMKYGAKLIPGALSALK